MKVNGCFEKGKYQCEGSGDADVTRRCGRNKYYLGLIIEDGGKTRGEGS